MRQSRVALHLATRALDHGSLITSVHIEIILVDVSTSDVWSLPAGVNCN